MDLIRLLNNLKTPAGGWRKSDLAAMGVSWPPPKGWKAQLIIDWSKQDQDAWISESDFVKLTAVAAKWNEEDPKQDLSESEL